MPQPYFQKSIWPHHSVGSITYTFGHLSEFTFQVTDTKKIVRTIAVTFSDHVFTRDSLSSDLPADAFPGCSRQPSGHVCQSRYDFSLLCPGIIQTFQNEKVWCLNGADRYANITFQTPSGGTIQCSIIFTLDKVRGLPVDLHMQVRSAFPITQGIATFGQVRFSRLVELRMNGQHPKKVYDARRKKP